MINNGFDHFKYSVHIRFIRNTANPYSVYKKPNPNTANPYSAYKKTNPNSFISYSVYKKRNYSVPYIFGFGRIIRIRLTPIPSTGENPQGSNVSSPVLRISPSAESPPDCLTLFNPVLPPFNPV